MATLSEHMSMLDHARRLARQRIEKNTNRSHREGRLPSREIAEWMEHHAEAVSGFCDIYFECCARLHYLDNDVDPVSGVFGHKLHQYLGKDALIDRAINDLTSHLRRTHPFLYGSGIQVILAGPAVTRPFCTALIQELESDAHWLHAYVDSLDDKAEQHHGEERGYKGMSDGVGALGSVAHAIRLICEVRRDVDGLLSNLENYRNEHISHSYELERNIREIVQYIRNESIPNPSA